MSKTQETRRDAWRQLVAKQQQSGLSVRAFCQRHGTSEYSFYHWRKRLAEQLPMKFALVETSQSASAVVAVLEVVLPSGERLRIVPGVDAATLRVVLSVLREPR
ncbi:MAG: transposase [Terracidiphilus sp.]|jgi:transposase-like protein